MERLSSEGASALLALFHDLAGAVESHLRSIRTKLNATSLVTLGIRSQHRHARHEDSPTGVMPQCVMGRVHVNAELISLLLVAKLHLYLSFPSSTSR
jgi:hypothetical protein